MQLQGTRLFARLFSFDFECPRCGTVHQIRQGRKYPGWNPRTGTHTCRECSLTIQVGVLLYPTTAGKPNPRAIPEDWTPTPRQAAALRQLTTAIHLTEQYRKPKNSAPRNTVGPECRCQIDEPLPGIHQAIPHPACPIHRGAAGQVIPRPTLPDLEA